MSRTPVPRVDLAVVVATVSVTSELPRRTATAPSNSFGSGTSIVPSVPLISNSVRWTAESKEKIACADWPPANRISAPTWLGAVTSNGWPALGPDPMCRVARDEAMHDFLAAQRSR